MDKKLKFEEIEQIPIKRCKHYDVRVDLIKAMICSIASHPYLTMGYEVIHNDYYGDDALKSYIEECEKEPDDGRCEAPYIKFICEEILKLNNHQRELLALSMNFDEIECAGNCETCHMNNHTCLERN